MTVKLQQFNDASQSGDPVFEETLGRYMDDGKGGRSAGDGILTAEAVLDVPAGKIPSPSSAPAMRVFSRAQSQQVLLHPWPVSCS